MLTWWVGSTSEAVRSCTQVSLGAYRLALWLGVLQSGRVGVLSAGSLQEGINELNQPRSFSDILWFLFRTVEFSQSPPTCAHCHGCPGYHPHGRNAAVARGRYGDRCGVEGCGGDAVGLHHGGVMDHMWLSRIDRLGVISSLSRWAHTLVTLKTSWLWRSFWVISAPIQDSRVSFDAAYPYNNQYWCFCNLLCSHFLKSDIWFLQLIWVFGIDTQIRDNLTSPWLPLAGRKWIFSACFRCKELSKSYSRRTIQIQMSSSLIQQILLHYWTYFQLTSTV